MFKDYIEEVKKGKELKAVEEITEYDDEVQATEAVKLELGQMFEKVEGTLIIDYEP